MKTLLKTFVVTIILNLSSPVAFAAKILLSEIVVTPTGGEFIEIYNPTSSSVDLTNYWLSDSPNYHLISDGSSPSAVDFMMNFPAGSSIAANSFATVSLESGDTNFVIEYGISPDYNMDTVGARSISTTGGDGLTNSGELVVLFVWDGVSDLVTDVDYLLYGNSNSAVDKTGVTVGTSSYLADTDVTSQDIALAPGGGQSLQRIDFSEGLQTMSGGNGITGGDETSEDLSATWAVFSNPTPGAAVVPVPAAAWLFGSALGVLGWLRRRNA